MGWTIRQHSKTKKMCLQKEILNTNFALMPLNNSIVSNAENQ